MRPKKESLTNLENQMEKITNISLQTNENIEKVEEAIADTKDQLKKNKWKLKPAMDNSK